MDLQIDLVTPVRSLYRGHLVSEIKIPTSNGQIQVLPNHRSLLALLAPGVLSFTDSSGERKFAVSYGFLEVRHNKVVVLAETCEESTEIDLTRAKAAQQKADRELSGALTEESFKKYQLKVQRAIARQQASH